MKDNYLKKLVYNICVYSPVFALFSLIFLIYFSFINDYCISLLYNDKEIFSNIELFLGDKSSFFIFLVSFFTLMMIINMIRVIISNPGYIPLPNELEYKIVLKHSLSSSQKGNADQIKLNQNKNMVGFLQSKYDFLNSVEEDILNGPLYSKEAEMYYDNINYFLNDKNNFNYENKHSFSQINNLSLFPFDSEMNISIDNDINIKDDDDIFDNFLIIDLTKAVLCNTCMRYKVERTHHCRICGKCVLKMDHHCPWLANCIGFNNHKFFLLIQFYGFLASSIILLTYWKVIYYNFNIESTSLLKCWYSLFVYSCNLCLFLFLLWLILVNWKLVFFNLTIIENSDKERFPNSKALNIYDLGKYKNFCSVFGGNPLLWLLPIQSNIKGKGIIYENIYKFKSMKYVEF